MKTFKILGLLLEYPKAETLRHMEELKAALVEEAILPKKVRKSLFAFMDELSAGDLLSLQENYVASFDRSRVNSLYLFEHVHGESRDRGQAMVDLSDQYRDHGFQISAKELPDFVPLFLEYLSARPFADAQSLLGETVHILAAIGAKLKKKKNHYHHVFDALQALTDVKVDARFIEQAVADAADEDTSLDALDKEWEETPAFDGDGQSACTTCPQATRFDGAFTPSETGGQNDFVPQ